MSVFHESIFKTYLNGLVETAKRRDAREESFYPVLADFLRDFASATGHKNVHVTVQPRPTEGGNPDFRVWDGQEAIVGYIEAKPPHENLDKIEGTQQLRRYLDTFPNVILTNFSEFRLYRNGRRVETALLARPVVIFELQSPPPLHDPQGTAELLELFFSFSLPPSFNAKDLAVALAKRTRLLRDAVLNDLK
ncbi:MAG TPA: DNA methyltransferase, partial [Firmicutes bacterium]|nr:DNA methyltransferase [Bacillota bacterium]